MIDDTVRCEFNAVLPVVFVRTRTGQKTARDLARIVPFMVDFKTHRVDVDSLSDERGYVGAEAPSVPSSARRKRGPR